MLLNIVSHPIRSMMCPEIGLTKIWGEEIFKLDLVQHKFLSEKYSLLNLKSLSTGTIDVKISQLSHALSIYILCNHFLTNSIIKAKLKLISNKKECSQHHLRRLYAKMTLGLKSLIVNIHTHILKELNEVLTMYPDEPILQ